MLNLSTQGYYKWLKAPVFQRDWDDAHAIDALLGIHAADPALGYRFFTDELADAGITRLREPGLATVLDRWFLRLPPPPPTRQGWQATSAGS